MPISRQRFNVLKDAGPWYTLNIEYLAIASGDISSADLCDNFRPRSGPTFPDLDPNCCSVVAGHVVIGSYI